MSELIRIRDLNVVRDEKTICAVDELLISSGERLLLTGINGSGKTTLLRVIAGLETDYNGDVSFANEQVDRVYVHQSPLLFRGTVLFNSMYGLAARNGNSEEHAQVAQMWLKRFEVAHLADLSSHKLSGGERRRVSLARVFALKPKMLLLDEPFSDLDGSGQECLTNAIDELTETAFVITSPVPISGLQGIRTIECGQNSE